MRARMVWAVGLLLAASLSGGGCASIITGTRQSVRFESEPPGATVRMHGKILGETPCDVVIEKKAIGPAEFVLAGHQTRFVNPAIEGQLSVEPTFYGNLGLLFVFGLGAPVGMMVDYLDGAMYRLQTPFCVSLYPLEAAAPQDANGPLGAQKTQLSRTNSTASPPRTATERAKELKDLKDQGLLSGDEYERRRQTILDEIAGPPVGKDRVTEGEPKQETGNAND